MISRVRLAHSKPALETEALRPTIVTVDRVIIRFHISKFRTQNIINERLSRNYITINRRNLDWETSCQFQFF